MESGAIAIVFLAAVVTTGLVALARIVTVAHTRRHLVDRGLSAEEIHTVLHEPPGTGYGSLRAGLVLFAVGIALIAAQYLPFGAGDPFVYGLVLAAAGAGLLAHHRLVRSLRGGDGPREE